jgi:hypothetical protein
MALTTVHSGKEARLFIAQETAFGTPKADDTAWAADNADGVIALQLVGDPSPVDVGGVIRDSTIRSHGQRVKKNTDIYISRDGAIFTMPFEVIPTLDDIDFLIYTVMQDIESESDAGTYERIFTIDRDTTQPDFGANGGKFLTVTLDDPIASENDQLTSAIISELTLSSDPGTNGGRMTASGTFFSGFDYSHDNNLAPGASIVPDTHYFNHSLLQTKTIGGTAVVVNSWSLTINNNAQRVGSDTIGDAQSYAIGVPEYTITGELNVKYDSETKDMLDTFLAGTDTLIVLNYGSASSEGFLQFTINASFTGHTKDFGGDAGMFLSIPFEGVDDGTNDALKIEMDNSLNRAWIS